MFKSIAITQSKQTFGSAKAGIVEGNPWNEPKAQTFLSKKEELSELKQSLTEAKDFHPHPGEWSVRKGLSTKSVIYKDKHYLLYPVGPTHFIEISHMQTDNITRKTTYSREKNPSFLDKILGKAFPERLKIQNALISSFDELKGMIEKGFRK